MKAWFVLNDLFLTIGPLGSSTTGRFSIVSMESKCAWIMGTSGKFLVGWPYSSQMVQGKICRVSTVAFTFFSLVTKVEVATEVAAMVGETMEEISLMDHW